MSATTPCKNALTIDVEDYFHVAALSKAITPDQWDNYPSRVEKNTDTLLELFAKAEVKATFFVLGWVAERYPSIVKRIDEYNHEIASHGYSHQLIYKQTPAIFHEETKRSKNILEDITGKKVDGYRAASYSITRKSLWALDTLAELGFTWDSSIFPVHHDNYGIPNSPLEPYELTTNNGAKLLEFPLTTAKLFGAPIPAAGGGYFRQYPYALSRWLFERAGNNGERPAVFYLHPWEIDPDQPRIKNISWFSAFRHYTNLHRCHGRLEKMITDFEFTTMGNVLKEYDITTEFNTSNVK